MDFCNAETGQAAVLADKIGTCGNLKPLSCSFMFLQSEYIKTQFFASKS